MICVENIDFYLSICIYIKTTNQYTPLHTDY